MFDAWMSEHNVAGRFLTLCARIFGKKCVATDDRCTMTSYFWRGCVYVTKIEFAGE
jgi:hypothetical protein